MRKRKLYNWQAPRDIKYPHIIVLIEPSEIAENEIRQVYPDLFKLNAGTFLTRTEDSSDKICKAIGIGNEGTGNARGCHRTERRARGLRCGRDMGLVEEIRIDAAGAGSGKDE